MAQPSTLVYLVGGPAGPTGPANNVYGSLNAAIAAANVFDGADVDIFIDDHLSVGNAVWTAAGSPYNMTGIKLIGATGVTALQINDGVVCSSPWRDIQNLAVTSLNLSNVMTLGAQTCNIGENVSFVCQEGIEFWNNTAPFTAVLSINGPNASVGDGTNSCVFSNIGAAFNVWVGPNCKFFKESSNGTGALNVTQAPGALGTGAQPAGLTKTFAVTSSLAHGWADNAAQVNIGANTVVTSVTVTPSATGKFRVTATGAFVPGGATTLGFALGVSGVVSYDLTENMAGGVVSSVPNSNSFGVTVETNIGGYTALPQTFPVGTPVTFNVVGLSIAGAPNMPAHKCQLDVQEIP